jgi:hypothetical protein
MKILCLAAIATTLLSPVAAYAAPVTTSPGKNAVHSAESNVLNGSGDIVTLTGTIEKGKKKTVLEIEASVSVAGSASLNAVYVSATINGYFPANPYFSTTHCNSANAQLCTITQTFWLDIDAAEAANVGAYVGQPLNIIVAGGNQAFAGAGLNYNASFTARVVKK